MIPASKDWSRLARLNEGDLAEVPFATLLPAFAAEERTLILEIKRDLVEKRLVFDEGCPVDCGSNLVHESLGNFLVSREKLSAEDHRRCLAESARTGAPLQDVLLASGLINAYDLFRVLEQNLGHKLLDLFTWERGRFRVLPELPAPGAQLRVKVPEMVLYGVTRLAPDEVVDRAMGPAFGETWGAYPEPPLNAGAMKLSGKHARALTLLKKKARTLDELLAETKLPREELTRLAYALIQLRVIVRASELPTELVAPPKAEPTPASKAASATREWLHAQDDSPRFLKNVVDAARADAAGEPAMGRAQLAQLREEVSRLCLSLERLDAFQLLGVDPPGNANTVRAKYLERAQRFAPWRFEGELKPLQRDAETVFLYTNQ